MYRRVPDHPQLTEKADPKAQARRAAMEMRLIKGFLKKELTFLEVGPGDCSLSFEVAKSVKKVYAIDVSKEITKKDRQPRNFDLIISDGYSIPVPMNSIDMVYSSNLMEHLHPDDALDQLRNIYNALVDGGIYFCIVPNHLSWPHDISTYFDEIATGFHLKEYTTTELIGVFKMAGFKKFRSFIGPKGFAFLSPVFSSYLDGGHPKYTTITVKNNNSTLPANQIATCY